MSETKHTPGPWNACRKGHCDCNHISSANHPVAKVISGDWGDDYPTIRLVGTSSLDQKAEAYMEQITYGSISKEMAIANSQLIAAAPDLLQCLEDVEYGFLKWPDDGVWPRKMEMDESLYLRIKAALAKAKGR